MRPASGLVRNGPPPCHQPFVLAVAIQLRRLSATLVAGCGPTRYIPTLRQYPSCDRPKAFQPRADRSFDNMKRREFLGCLSAAAVFDLRAVDSPAVAPGWDWSLPAGIKPVPYSGFTTWGKTRFSEMITVQGIFSVGWRQSCPAPGEYDWKPMRRCDRQRSIARHAGRPAHPRSGAAHGARLGGYEVQRAGAGRRPAARQPAVAVADRSAVAPRRAAGIRRVHGGLWKDRHSANAAMWCTAISTGSARRAERSGLCGPWISKRGRRRPD